MSLPTAYLTSAKNTNDILQAIQSAQAPARFTQKFLEGLGFPSTNDRTMINVLKSLGFLDDSGVPTRRYHQYLDQTQSAIILAQGIREAYADLFRLNRKANSMTTVEIKNKMKTISEGLFSDRVLTLMASTFATLVKSADFTSAPADTEDGKQAELGDDEVDDATDDAQEQDDLRRDRSRLNRSRIGDLVYSVNIILPESRDPAVYDALFKALREHLG
jgi:hypothetical protein